MTHVNVREVLESLTLAKEAYDAVPDLRRQIDDLQAAVASKDRLLAQTNSSLQETIQSKANVEAKLKQTEEERDAYGFRAIDAEEKLEKVFGVVKPAVAPIQPQVSEVGQSEVPLTPTAIGSSYGSQNAATASPSSDGAHVSTKTGQSASAPTAQTAQATTGAVSADTAKSSSTEPGQSAPLPTPAPASTTTGTTEPIAVTEPVVNPTQDWGKSAEAQAQSVTLPKSYQSDSGDESTHAVIDKPYLGHPSWEKPHDMSWNEWEAKGGTVPGWMKSAH